MNSLEKWSFARSACSARGLAGGVESGECSTQDRLRPAPVEADQRFDHYELVTAKKGNRSSWVGGAMGVTYKAVDVDLRCPVTLKVISERYLGDESAAYRAKVPSTAKRP
jgi:hypothetical protein